MNKVILIGRITKDLELKYSSSKEPIAILKFALAVSRKYKKENEPNADFINCTAFNKTAEFIEKYFSKGQMIAVIGEVRNNNYESKTGEKIYSQEILINNAEFCGDYKKDNPDNENSTSEDFYIEEETTEDENLPF